VAQAFSLGRPRNKVSACIGNLKPPEGGSQCYREVAIVGGNFDESYLMVTIYCFATSSETLPDDPVR